jgi:hypothetical protein
LSRGLTGAVLYLPLHGTYIFNKVLETFVPRQKTPARWASQLSDQQQRAQEAGKQLTQESVNAYIDFVNSLFSFYQGSAAQIRWQT